MPIRLLIAAFALCCIAITSPAWAGELWESSHPALQSLQDLVPKDAAIIHVRTAPVVATDSGKILVNATEVREIATWMNPGTPWDVEKLLSDVPVERLPKGWVMWLDVDAEDGASLGAFGVARAADGAGVGLARTTKHSGHCHCHDCSRCSCDCYWWTDSWCDCDCRHCDEPSDGAAVVGAVIVGAVVGAALAEDCAVGPPVGGSGVVVLLGLMVLLGVVRSRRWLGA